MAADLRLKRNAPLLLRLCCHWMVRGSSGVLRNLAERVIAGLRSPHQIAYVWGVWAETRNPAMFAALNRLSIPAPHPNHLFVLSRLALLQHTSELEKCSPDQVAYLITACQDSDSSIAYQSRAVIVKLTRPATIAALIEHWLKTRIDWLAELIIAAGYIPRKPPAARVAGCLLNNRLNPILTGEANLLDALLSACRDSDPRLSEPALRCLPALQSADLISALCATWISQPDPIIEKAILQANYLPDDPAHVRLLIALKTSRLHISQACSPELLPVLLGACQSHDETIRKNAHKSALALNEPTQEALCALVLDNDHPIAHQIALEARYLPNRPESRALFLFLTEQWEEYVNFDFDQSLLRTVYSTANPDIRRRLAEKIRVSGKLQFVDILSGPIVGLAETTTPIENETFIRLLLENQQYDRLWSFIDKFDINLARRVVGELNHAGWLPKDSSELHLFQSLFNLNDQGLEDGRIAPFALRRALLRVRGRVNEVAFSPTSPWIAIGTGQGKVVVWDYHTGAIHKILTGFNHSIGQVAFTSSGILLIGERTSYQGECALYTWNSDQIQKLGSHAGSITAIEPLDEYRVLSAGRDQKVILWDIGRQEKMNERSHYTWLRHLTASHDHSRVVFLTDNMMIYDLPGFTHQHPSPYKRRMVPGHKSSVVRCAAFSPDNQELILGHNNGQVIVYGSTSQNSSTKKTPLPNPLLTRHPSSVQQVVFLPDRPIISTAGAEGQVRFFEWPSQKLIGVIDHAEGRLTTLNISPNGSFIATGTNEAVTVLWDMRLSRLSDLSAKPIVSLTPSDLATITSLLGADDIPPQTRKQLEALRLILTHRFRYDIQVEDSIAIQPGEFDIVLE